jgi:citrate synthase
LPNIILDSFQPNSILRHHPALFLSLIQTAFDRVYDPGYVNTACCESSICKIDGDKGELTFRGYSIEELVEKSTFLEVAYLLIFGELPDKDQTELWETKITRHTFIHENLVQLMKNFRYVRLVPNSPLSIVS